MPIRAQITGTRTGVLLAANYAPPTAKLITKMRSFEDRHAIGSPTICGLAGREPRNGYHPFRPFLYAETEIAGLRAGGRDFLRLDSRSEDFGGRVLQNRFPCRVLWCPDGRDRDCLCSSGVEFTAP